MRKYPIGAACVIGLYMAVMLLVSGQANAATDPQYALKGPQSVVCSQCHGNRAIPADLTTFHNTHAKYDCSWCHTFSAPGPTPTPTPTGCTATIAGNLVLHIPYLSYVDPVSGAFLLWTDFVYELNPTYPTLILFKFLNAGIINNPVNLCSASTLSVDFKIHILDVLLPDGITHLRVDLEYDPALSTVGNAYFLVTNFGVVPH
jgi:hypothetical protein